VGELEGASDTFHIHLHDAIELGISRSVDAVVAQNQYTFAYWEYRTFRTELLPEVVFNTTLPYFSRSHNQIQNPDGSVGFVASDFSRVSTSFSINQNIPLTGGRVSVESSVERLRQHGGNASTHFMAVPGRISLDQPLFGFNRVRWLQRIEPIRYQEARKRLASNREEIALVTIEYYFNLLLGRINLDMAKQTRDNAERLYTVANARHEMGQLSQVDLLQMRASKLRAEAALTNAQASFNARMFQLRSFLGFGEDVVLEPVVPEFLADDIPMLSYSEVLDMALTNNPFTQNIQRRMLEASRNVSQSRADRWNMRLFASFGMSGQESHFRDVMHRTNWRDDQIAMVGISIPILDWGRGKGRVRTAEANRKVTEARIEKEQMDFNQQIFLTVQHFNNQPTQLRLARETDAIAQQRYEISVEAFILGNLDILNLNDSQTARDEARRDYINQMFLLWSYYYQIRSLTLFDFLRGEMLGVN
jgi:outer membrane protein TolC